MQEWGEFLHKPNEMFYDFGEIRNEIVLETDRITGKLHFVIKFVRFFDIVVSLFRKEQRNICSTY